MKALYVYGPEPPYTVGIPGGMVAAKMIRIKGSMLCNASDTAMELSSCTTPEGDIPLHLHICAKQGKMVRNTCLDGKWGCEETEGRCCIEIGKPFEILILADHSCYKIAVNGQHFCTFAHRLSLDDAKYLNLEPGASIDFITIEENADCDCSPSPVPPKKVKYPSSKPPC